MQRSSEEAVLPKKVRFDKKNVGDYKFLKRSASSCRLPPYQFAGAT